MISLTLSLQDRKYNKVNKQKERRNTESEMVKKIFSVNCIYIYLVRHIEI